MSAVAEELAGTEAEQGIQSSPAARSPTAGSPGANDVEPPSQLRLYRATAEKIDALDENDRRVPVTL